MKKGKEYEGKEGEECLAWYRESEGKKLDDGEGQARKNRWRRGGSDALAKLPPPLRAVVDV